MNEVQEWQRTSATLGVLYAEPSRSAKRRRCDGHLADRHWIEVGDMVIHSACPPDHPDIGNIGWWHHTYCLACAPTPRARGTRT